MALFPDSPFMIDGVRIKPPLMNDPYEWNVTEIAWRDSHGSMIDRPVTQADKFKWAYKSITLAELREITAIIGPKMDAGNNSFLITSWTPDRGFVTVRCYLGNTIKYNVAAVDSNNVPNRIDTEFSWIQKDGSLRRLGG